MEQRKFGLLLALLFVIALIGGAGVTALLINIHEKQEQGRQYPLMLMKVSDDDVNPEVWGKNFPSEYDTYMQMAETGRWTLYGGSAPYSKLIRYPQLVSLWAGYPFSEDFNEERGHYYAQIDQLETKRNNKEWLNSHGFPKFQGQPGACMNCHSGWAPGLIREMGWEAFNKTPYSELADKLKARHGEGIHANLLGGTCADCHSPKDMSLRVTRPAYINAMVARGYAADPDHGISATRREMRSHVCQQCHVEYYFKKGSNELTFPWTKWPKDQPLRFEMIDAYYDEAASAAENPFKADFVHKDTGAPMIKIQHPETEVYSSGIHARAGVACTDCHMPYMRVGSVKMTSHKIASPLFSITASCQTCHNEPQDQLRKRVEFSQQSTNAAMREAEGAILALIDDFKQALPKLMETDGYKAAASQELKDAYVDSILAPARVSHRKASMRWDFVFSENSGFHSPQESVRVLAQSVDFARKGQLQIQEAMQKLGISIPPVTGRGRTPPPPEPLPGRQSPVGDPPPGELVSFDRQAYP